MATWKKRMAKKPKNMDVHTLKTWPEYFEAIWSGKKNFEIRKADRDFKVGDCLILLEYDPEANVYTTRETDRKPHKWKNRNPHG